MEIVSKLVSKMRATDRIVATVACSYGLFWGITLVSAIIERTSFRPNFLYYIAAGCAILYVSSAVLTLIRVKGAKRFLQVGTAVATFLILVAFGIVFAGETNLIGRGLLVAFGQLQIVYALSVWLLLEHECRPPEIIER